MPLETEGEKLTPGPSALDYKQAGNKLCLLNRYEEALGYYTKAINKCPSEGVFFSNRALCHLKLHQWDQAIQDSRRALELDHSLIKAHFFLGQALAETMNYDESLKHLQLAHELAIENKINFGDDIASAIRLIKRLRWSKIEEDSLEVERNLQSYITNLIIQDREKKAECLRNRKMNKEDEHDVEISARTSRNCQQLTPTRCSGDITPNDDLIASSDTKEVDPVLQCDIYLKKVEELFNDLKAQRKRRDVPEYLCGKISFEIMHDPVITPSGITYNRHDIEEHLRRVGHFDPITRQPLRASQLISNLAMKEVVDSYLHENEWAIHY